MLDWSSIYNNIWDLILYQQGFWVCLSLYQSYLGFQRDWDAHNDHQHCINFLYGRWCQQNQGFHNSFLLLLSHNSTKHKLCCEEIQIKLLVKNKWKCVLYIIGIWRLPGEGSLSLLKKVQYWGDNFCSEKRFDLDMISFNFIHRFLMVEYANLNISFPLSSLRITSRSFKALSWASRETPKVFISKYVNIFSYTTFSFIIAHLLKHHRA